MNKNTKFVGLLLSTLITTIAIPEVALSQNSEKDYFQQGKVHLEEDNLQQAIESYTQAIEVNPDLAEAYSNRGFAYLEQENSQQAIEDLEKAATLFQEQGQKQAYREIEEMLNQLR